MKRPLNLLYLALGAMFLQQTFVSIGRVLPAVLAPAVIADLHFDPALVGVYFGITSCAALLAQLGCGSFILRYGPLRMSQVALVLLTIGMACMAGGVMPMFVLSAVIGGGGSAISTPASSQLLGRWSPPRLAPLIFSIKQTAVPAGLLLAGSLGPALAGSLGWRGVALISALACFTFVFMMQPIRKLFDTERVATRSFQLSDFKTTILSVLKVPELRSLAFASFAFNGLQSVMTAYLVIYLTTIGYDPVAAGYIFSVAMAVAVPGRILWGWLGSFLIAPRLVMAGLALGMAVSSAVLGSFTNDWPVLAIGFVTCLLSATAMSWHGVLLSETARLAPAGMAGSVTGGVLSFGQLGALLAPLTYSALLSGTGSYGIGFIVTAVPALLVAISLFRQGRRVMAG